MFNKQTIGALILLCFLSKTNAVFAHSAEVMPKGRTSVGLSSNIYFTVGEKFNQDKEVEDVDVHYNTTLNKNVFGDLASFEGFPFNMPAGLPNIGRSVISYQYDFSILNFSIKRGITDRLTVGVSMPYWYVKNNVEFSVDTASATIGKRVAFADFWPIGVGGSVPLTTGDVQNLFGNGLDIDGNGSIDIDGYEYKPIENYSYDGIGDIEADFRYQYHETDNWKLAFTGGIRFPTGKEDDTDNLMDYATGSGAYALLARLNNDYTGIKDLVVNTTLMYDYVLPYDEVKRIFTDPDLPLAAASSKEEVEIDIGDAVTIEVAGEYTLFKGASASLLYRYLYKQSDQVSGKGSSSYSGLEDETDVEENVYIVGFSYSTIPLYLEKKFPVPLDVSISYRNRFAGENCLKSDYIALGLQFYF